MAKFSKSNGDEFDAANANDLNKGGISNENVDGSYGLPGGTTAGAADVYTLTFAFNGVSWPSASYQENLLIRFKIHATNTGASTIEVNGLGAVAIVDWDNVAMVAGQLLLDRTYLAQYDGTSFRLVNGNDKGVLQVVSNSVSAVSTTTTAIPNDDTIPQIGEGVELLTQAITPKSEDSDLIIIADLNCHHDVGSGTVTIALFVGATADALTSRLIFAATQSSGTLMIKIAAGSTTARTYRIRVSRGSGVGTVTINGTSGGRIHGGVALSNLLIMEVRS